MSELVITAAGFTIQPVTNLPDGAAILRWAYNRPFLASDNIQVQWGTLNSGFGVEVPCAIADGLITVDQDSTLWTTDDAQDTNPLSILVSAWLLNSRRKLIQQLQIANKAQWIVPSSLAPSTSWAEFSNYNQAVALYYYNPNFYNAPETDRQIRLYAATNYATDSHLGGVYLSVPADLSDQPVVLGINDPLIGDATSIEGIPVSDAPPLDGQVLVYNEANNEYEPANQNAGTGNVISNEVSSVDSQVVIASGTGGKTVKFYEDDGLVRTTGGVPAPATVATADIDNEAVTYAKMQNVSAASRLLGRGSASGAGDVEEVSLGSGLSMSGTTLSATGTGGDVTAAANLTDEAVVVGDGGVKGVQTTPVTINPGTGLMAGATVDDPTTAQQLASKNYVDSAVATVAGSVPLLSGLASGGVVFWESAYTFRVNAATYYIQGILYSSTEQTVTLDAADPTLDRIDVIALDTTGTVVKITGTAAAQPSQPDIDPSTQLQLTFVFVGAATTQPAGVANEDIYLDNAEWTTSTSGSGWNPASTSNPYSGTLDIEGTNVANGAYVQLQRASPTALDSFDTLTMFIRSKATWNNNRVLRVQFFNAGVAVGTAITIATGFWGFNSSTTGVYQLVAIPVAQFVIAAGAQVNQLRITDVGGAIGLFIDNIVLQTNGANFGPPAQSGITQDQADARYLQRTTNLSDLTSASTARTNLGLGTLATQNGTFSGTSSGTNTGDVTLAGALDYLTIAGQVITRAAIDLATDITGDLPFANLTPATGASVLLGRGDSGAGDFQEITLGTNLSMSGTTLNATGGASFAGVTSGGTGALDMAQGSKTASEPFIEGTATYNSAGVTFTAMKLDITDTASAVGSRLIDLASSSSVLGATVFAVQKANSGIWHTRVTDGSNSVPGITSIGDPDTGITWNEAANVISFLCGGGVVARIRSTQIETGGSVGFVNLNGSGVFRWDSGTRLIHGANAVLRIDGNSDDTANAGIILGGTSASFPRLRANGARLEARLANDSAYTQFTCEKLGVNNSAAGSTLGTVVKKTEIFDAAGASLGFIAIYDTIT